MRELRLKNSRTMRWLLAAAGLGLSFALYPVTAPHAQRGGSETPVNVTDVTAHTKGQDAVVSIAGDGALARAQTWQDDEGFHVVVYKGQNAVRAGLPRGVKARRVGDSLELVVPVKAGSNVYVRPRFNQLDLFVGGGLQAGAESRDNARQAHGSTAEQQTGEQSAHKNRAARGDGAGAVTTRETGKRKATGAQEPAPQLASVKAQTSAPVQMPAAVLGGRAPVGSQQAESLWPSSYQGGAQAGQNNQTNNQPTANAPVSVAQLNVPPPPQTAVVPPAEQAPVAATAVTETSAGLTFPLTVLGLCFTGGLVGFMFIYRRQRKVKAEDLTEPAEAETSTALTRPAPKSLSKTAPKTIETPATLSTLSLEPHPQGERRRDERRRNNLGRRASDKASGVPLSAPPAQPATEKPERRPSFTHTPAVVFGAYRIDQEVEKLIQGQPHSIEVLAARAVDDRRAVETSLLKALQSNMLGEDERRRARLALEEYGFVARQSAALLLASEVYDRTMAARVLGQVGAASSLPFLLEALHDPEPIVCTEAVTSLGALGLPSAIGALLDLARRNPELPAPLLGRALSACSVDCIDVGASYDETGRLLAGDSFTGDIDGLEPVGQIEQLPEWLEDHTLADALERLGSTDVEVRTAAAQQLAQFQVQRAVDALAILASDDRDATVRATAVTSLGIIGHESVFASVLISMADEAREVRAAAARALSRLNFDRADAYVRVIDSGDSALMQRVARACAQAGLTTKALDRLASEDRRQAYEAFSLLSLVIKAGESETILTVVEQAGDLNVRLAAARLLALQGQPDVVRRLRRVALGDGTPEKLRNAILEAIYRDDHAAVE